MSGGITNKLLLLLLVCSQIFSGMNLWFYNTNTTEILNVYYKPEILYSHEGCPDYFSKLLKKFVQIH